MKVHYKTGILLMAPLIVFLISCSSTEIPEGNSQANSLTRDVFLPSTDYSLYTLIGPYEDLWLVSDEFKPDTVNSSFENLIKVETAKIIVSKDMSQTYGSIESNNIKNLQEIESYFEDEISGTILSKHQSNHVDAIFSNQILDSAITGFGDFNQYSTLNEFDPEGLMLMSNLPHDPSLELVAVGAMSRDMKAINMLSGFNEFDFQLLARAYKTMNGGKIVFGAYTSGDTKITFSQDKEIFQDSISGLVFLTHSTYASPLVSFLVRQISEELEMTNHLVEDINVRHTELEGVNVVLKNFGSLVYLVVSNDLNEAEKLISSIFSPFGVN